MGRRLGNAHWGQGCATEARRASCDHTFGHLGPSRLISIADVPNTPSIAIMGRLTMTCDHHARLRAGSDTFDAVIYALGSRRTRTIQSWSLRSWTLAQLQIGRRWPALQVERALAQASRCLLPATGIGNAPNTPNGAGAE
ncbi:GNAT family N-acetyltransferase [Pelagibacterium sp.]|uniref:GNAT family N-acetyltransferase n=1 Tax=Pelagibacterium sp. TaxID=1967288 RepID=UPI003A8CA02E